MQERGKTFTTPWIQICEWNLISWNEIISEITIKFFFKYGIPIELDGTKDGHFWLDESNSGEEKDIPKNIYEVSTLFVLSHKEGKVSKKIYIVNLFLYVDI